MMNLETKDWIRYIGIVRRRGIADTVLKMATENEEIKSDIKDILDKYEIVDVDASDLMANIKIMRDGSILTNYLVT